MTTAAPSTALVTIQPAFTDPERLALAGFLAGYRGLTRDAAGLGPPAEHALISLLALNGLRVSEATGADIEQLGLERGHRTLTITRRAARSSPSRWRPAPPGRSTWPPLNALMGRSS